MEWVRDFPDTCLTHDQHLHYSGILVLTAEPCVSASPRVQCCAGVSSLVSSSHSTAEPLGAMFLGFPRNYGNEDNGRKGIHWSVDFINKQGSASL